MANALGGTTYIITFELGTGANAMQIETILKGYGTWAKITLHTWAIVSMHDKSTDIRTKLLPYIGVNGRVFVIKSGFESAWNNTVAKNEWLQKYLAN